MADRVLITGATGLLGRWVLRHWPLELEQPVAVPRPTDLTDSEVFISAIERARPDVVLHLAWSASGSADYRNSSENRAWVSTSMAAAKHCLEHGIHFVGTGTGIDHMEPSDAYARSKCELRKALMREIEQGVVTWLRPFYVFDVAARRPRLVADTLKALHSGDPVLLESPWVRHDFVHASDVGSAIVACLVHDLRGSIDIGSGRLRSVAELVEACGASWHHASGHDSAQHSGAAASTSALLTTNWTPSATEDFFTA